MNLFAGPSGIHLSRVLKIQSLNPSCCLTLRQARSQTERALFNKPFERSEEVFSIQRVNRYLFRYLCAASLHVALCRCADTSPSYFLSEVAEDPRTFAEIPATSNFLLEIPAVTQYLCQSVRLTPIARRRKSNEFTI